MRRFRYREAESLCRQALRIDRRNVTAYEILGDIHRARGSHDEAVAMYSYALQLDRNNRGLREKFDKLVGERTGPTMSGRAAASVRSKSTSVRSPIKRKLANTRAVINGMGAALVGTMLAVVAISDARLAASPIYLEWAPVLLLGLASSGWMCGFVLAVNRRIGRFFDELTGIKHGTRIHVGPMVGAFTIVASVVSLYGGFLIYALLGAIQKYHSISLLFAFGTSLAIAALFSLAAEGSGIYVLISGGSVVFLSFLIGWIIGDTFR